MAFSDRDDKIDILRHHRFSRPVVHRDATYCAPRNVRFLQRLHETHDVVSAARGLPIEELLGGHILSVPLHRRSTTAEKRV